MSIHAALASLILWAAFISAAPADPPPKAKSDATRQKQDPKTAEDYVKRGVAHLLKDDLNTGIADLTEALRLGPKNVEALRPRADAYFRRGEYAKAAADQKKIIEIDPGDWIAHYSLAHLLVHCPDPKFRDGKRAAEHAKKACELKEWKHGTMIALLAAAHAETGEFDEAVKHQKKAIETLKVEGIADRDDEESRLKLYETIVRLSRAIEADPKDPERYYNRGEAFAENSMPEKAISDFSRAIKLKPKSGKYFLERGRVHLSSGSAFRVKSELEKAIADFAEVRLLDPKDRSAIDYLVMAYYEIGEYAKAAEVHRKEIEKDPNNAVSLGALARILAACPDPKVRDGKKAVEHAKKACEIYEWKVDHIIEVLAAAHAEAGEFDKAVKYQKEAIDLAKANGFEPLDSTKNRLKLYEAKKPVRCKSLLSDW